MEQSQEKIIQQLEQELRVKSQQVRQLQEEIKVLKSKSKEEENNEEEEEQDDDEEEETLSDKIKNYLSHSFQRSKEPIYKAELYLSAINSLATIYHLDYDQELDVEELRVIPLVTDYSNAKGKMKQQLMVKACKIAFNYSIDLFRQLNETNLSVEKEEVSFLGFPLQWLLGIFPFNDLNRSSLTNTIWLPLHLFLAYNPYPDQKEQYLEDLNLLLMEFGEAAFQEEFSPLSIAVSKREPNLSVIQRIIEFKPNAFALEDEDGSIPIHHACACNDTTEIIRYLYSLDQHSLEKVDNFGASAIHYATFYGHMDVVKYLLEIQPLCVKYAEGNGALPLHDAVQNHRGRYHQAEIAEMLLQLCPEAASKRDSSGAFPFHRAVQFSNKTVAQLLISYFPHAVFAADSETLLPIHYFSQRKDKDQQLDLLQYILELNPKGTTFSEEELFPKVKTSTKSAFSFFSGHHSSSSSSASAAPSAKNNTKMHSNNNRIHRGSVIARKSIAMRRTSIRK